MKIKICGLTTLDDALAAVDAGADYLGFNFYPKSPRYIAPDDCARITDVLRGHGDARAMRPTLVGIFVNASPAAVAVLLDRCGLDLAQLHGDETPAQLMLLEGRAYKGVRDVAMKEREREKELAAFAAAGPGHPALLVDAYTPDAYGGTGRAADWPAARAAARQFPIFLAGGLTPENVGDAIAQVRPWGVDVASGVESAPGRKDAEKIRAFIRAARGAQGTQGNKGTEENFGAMSSFSSLNSFLSRRS